ncbi:hypothetical protein QJS04_geneDACA006223 [Acorus gramineus]|uniref:Uncharacterized protein n=1 Tax=Acorus gramineus TaxID=55184 RepID=A0AAV9AUP0_ACOGR|nr:hypothetical protein QJS04_geneDACA006223 [Acorus gramineus]
MQGITSTTQSGGVLGPRNYDGYECYGEGPKFFMEGHRFLVLLALWSEQDDRVVPFFGHQGFHSSLGRSFFE